jgi:diguanylate cyclase
MALDTRSENGKRNGAAAAAQQQELIRLLCRATTRLAVAAQGIDQRLDTMLGELRQLLRRELSAPQQLAELIDAIDVRIKHVDDERDQRTDILQRELLQLIAQLIAAKPPSAVAGALKTLQKNLKQSLADGEELTLLPELTRLQALVLAGGGTERPGLLARWFGGTAPPQSSAARAPGRTESASPEQPPEPAATVESVAAPALPEQAVVAAADSAMQLDSPDPVAAGEPPFARISAAVCQVLDELLSKIEPPPQAKDNYRHASEQIAKGLNWYELVSTLEEISQIVLAALERGEGEFQQFLQGLNQRLVEAHQTLQASRQHQAERRQADSALNEVVRMEVAEMQETVAQANDLEQLKVEVNVRLESVVHAMDHHKHSEQTRQRALEEQLDLLTERMRDMEVQSAAIEERMVEQRRLALLDTLTQLPNRQAYDERLLHEYQRWLRYRRPLALAVCDIDNFKLINDNYGHLAGDKVLRIIAKTLRTRLRQTDFIARFGGEEFVVLMPETGAAEALQTLDAIRLAVANCPFHFREQPVTITLSAGIAAFTEGAGPDLIFDRADSALYRAKQAGRNRCELDSTAAESAA